MRTRTRLLIAFLAMHLGLSSLLGLVAWLLISTHLRGQAAAAAASVGRLVGQTSFAREEPNRSRIMELTGYYFEVLPAGQVPVDRPGWIVAVSGPVAVAVDYRTRSYREAATTVLLGTLTVFAAGSLAFGLLAWWLAGRLARPIESLSAAARAIGAGDSDRPVPAVGQGEIAALAVDLEQMRQRLIASSAAVRRAERLAVLGTFTATIAHEVRNPLSAVRLTVQLLQRRLPGDEGLTLIAAELERLDLTVDELLAFSRGIAVSCECCRLEAIAADIRRLLARQAAHAGVTIELHGQATVQADPARMRQLLMNLVLNAIQAQSGGGVVTITVQADGLIVADHGPGIPPDLRTTLFDAFASSRPGGTGLGLHIAKAIAEAHGARLELVEVPHGACFRLSGLQARPAGCPS